jgi:uncharacterized protein YndB with AHSA1/START domain
MEGQATIHVNASPEVVYDLVSDVTRMGEWSPECVKCEWLDGATGPQVGARFKGTNKMGPLTWSTSPTVLEADRGKSFAFDAGATTWRYSFTPDNGGTSVTESFVVTSTITKIYSTLGRRQGMLIRGMQQTLERIKAVAEAQS